MAVVRNDPFDQFFFYGLAKKPKKKMDDKPGPQILESLRVAFRRSLFHIHTKVFDQESVDIGLFLDHF